MKQLLTFFVIAVFIYACGQSGESKAETTKEPAVAAVDGSKVYKQYCITCHGLYGDMGASGAFNLQTSTLSVEERVQVITEGRAGTAMAPFKSLLSPEKIQAVSEYTMTLTKEN